MADKKTLVIGSTGHLHVKSVDWDNLASVNIVDFDTVVINVGALTDKWVKSKNQEFYSEIRLVLARLLDSGGQIVVLGKKERAISGLSYYLSNYSWSPIEISIEEEAGNTISIHTNKYPNFLSRLKEWQFYYGLSNNPVTEEFIRVCAGNTGTARQQLNPFAINRYNQWLSFSVAFRIDWPRAAPAMTGSMDFLPELVGLSDRECVNLALEDLLGLPQEDLPPEWVGAVAMPLVEEIQKDIAVNKIAIQSLNSEIAAAEQSKREIEIFKKLLYSSGHDLEDIFARCLTNLGGSVTPAKYSQEEFVLSYKGNTFLIECKGIAKSTALTHVRQITDYILKYEEDEGRAGKGILLANAWKDLPLNERNTADKPMFPENVITRATALGIALVSSVDFFSAYCRFLDGKLVGNVLLERITSSVGVVNLQFE